MRRKLEICIDSFQSAQAACDGGADRIEICSNLAGGGTTPSYGLVKRCVEELPVETMVMIRPHDGGFAYSDDQLKTMIADIEIAKSLGVDGVVFGALDRQQQIDEPACRRLLAAADGMQTTFHRAFDVAIQPLQAFDKIQTMGFSRLLTSGQQPSALAGCDLIKKLIAQSDSTIVLAGAGVLPENAAKILLASGVQELHASASEIVVDQQSGKHVSFSGQRRLSQSETVRAIKRQMG